MTEEWYKACEMMREKYPHKICPHCGAETFYKKDTKPICAKCVRPL